MRACMEVSARHAHSSSRLSRRPLCVGRGRKRVPLDQRLRMEWPEGKYGKLLDEQVSGRVQNWLDSLACQTFIGMD